MGRTYVSVTGVKCDDGIIWQIHTIWGRENYLRPIETAEQEVRASLHDLFVKISIILGL
jgi:hypothetical protein